MKNRFFSLLLALVMVLSLFPALSAPARAYGIYDLWVGGVRVNAMNLDDILGDGGKAKYDPDTQELTLNDPNLTGYYPAEGSNAVIYSKMADVILKGSATIDATDRTWGVYAGETSSGYDGELILNGDFTVTGAKGYDLLSYGDLVVQGGTLTCGEMRGYNQNLRINGGSVTATKGIETDGNLYISNGAELVDATSKSNSGLYAYGKTISIGDELTIVEPDPAIVRDGRVYQGDDTTVAKHVVIANSAAFPLTITQQPKNYYGPEGELASFTVAADDLNVSYMWQYSLDNGENWEDADNHTDTLTVEIEENNDGIQYRCIVTDPFYRLVISDIAQLKLQNGPEITKQPQSPTITASESATFTVKATGTGLTYQWQYQKPGGAWKNCTSATEGYNTNTLTVQGVTGSTNRNNYMYRCIVTDVKGKTAISDAAPLYVFSFTIQPQDAMVNGGNYAEFTVETTLDYGRLISYQWQYLAPGGSWTDCDSNFVNYRTNTLRVRGVADSVSHDGYQFRCKARVDSSRTITSDPATLTVTSLPEIVTQPPASIGILGNEAREISVDAWGSGLTYQWQYLVPGGTWKNCSSATAGYNTKTILVQGVTGSTNRDGYQYRCGITGTGGTVISDTTTLHVVAIKTQPKDAAVSGSDYATFKVVATGLEGTEYDYQWQYKKPGGDWTDCSSATQGYNTDTLKVQGVTGNTNRNGYQYRCIVGYGLVISDTVTLTVTSGPSITKQPLNAAVIGTDTVNFKVTASGSGLKYQWQYKTPTGDWKDCSSATTGYNKATLSVAGVTGATNRDNYQYRCVVSSGSQSVTSNAATLRVFAIKTQPADASEKTGDTATFKVVATGPELTYQWQYKTTSGSWTNCTSATQGYNTATLKVEAAAKRNGYQYRCIVSSMGETLTSSAVTLTVASGPSISTQPKNFTGAVGDTATFTVKATGTGLTYQWQYKDVGGSWKDSSATSATATCKLTAARDGRLYRCIVTDANGVSVTSNTAKITVK